MGEQFEAKVAEIRAKFSKQLEPRRTAEIRERTLAAGQVNQTEVKMTFRAAVGHELGKDMGELTLLKNKANIR